MDKETIDKAAMEYSGLTDNPKDPNARERGCLCIAFSDGAHWRINSVWHDGREMPGYKRDFIYQSILKSGKVCLGMKMIFRDDEWDFIKKFCVIERWAYVDDLLPERKEGTK